MARAFAAALLASMLVVPAQAIAEAPVADRVAVQDENGRTVAEAGIVAFLRKSQSGRRPVTFVIGGGPGTSSAYLNLGALGPSRIVLSGAASDLRPLVVNEETWLGLTDLIFVDPPGTGQGRLLRTDAKTRERVWSVDGDIDLLADAIASWLRKHDRSNAIKVLMGQSYGGFRAPRIAEALHKRHGVALNGLILVSPVLDYGWRYHARSSPISYLTLLPSFAAARMESEGAFDAQKLVAVQDYASGAFVEDYLKGPRNREALQRMIVRVTAITGLPRAAVEAARGRVDEHLFTREFARQSGKVASTYDPGTATDDPDPSTPRPDVADPFLAALKAPLTAGMTNLLRENGKPPSIPYLVSNDTVFQNWQWSDGHGMPEAVTALRKMLALDQGLQVLIAHGYSDLQTPYFESALILSQLPEFGGRIQQRNYRGGHMFYSRDESRIQFRRDAEAFFGAMLKRP
ncbi:MAG: S10 family serine carboxypeptidase-like protein [Pseudomonadota bacterium]